MRSAFWGGLLGSMVERPVSRVGRRVARYSWRLVLVAAVLALAWWNQATTAERAGVVALAVSVAVAWGGWLLWRRERAPERPQEVGSVYRLRDPEGRVRYHGSSGDLARWVARMDEHVDARLLPIGPGWTVEAEFTPTREDAYRVEGQRIDAQWGDPWLLNRRREGRGR